MRVASTTNYVDVEGDYGFVDGVEVTCDRCGHYEESCGTGDGSLGRCATPVSYTHLTLPTKA